MSPGKKDIEKSIGESTRRDTLKSLAAVGSTGLIGSIASTSPVIAAGDGDVGTNANTCDCSSAGDGGSPYDNVQASDSGFYTNVDEEFNSKLGINVAYFGSFTNPNNPDSPWYHDFYVDSHVWANYQYRTNDPEPYAGWDYQEVTVDNNDSASTLVGALNSDPDWIGATPPDPDYNSDYVNYTDNVLDAVELAVGHIYPAAGFAYSTYEMASEMYNELMNAQDTSNDSSQVSYRWDYPTFSSAPNTPPSHMTNHLHFLVANEKRYTCDITATEEAAGVPGANSTDPLSAGLRFYTDENNYPFNASSTSSLDTTGSKSEKEQLIEHFPSNRVPEKAIPESSPIRKLLDYGPVYRLRLPMTVEEV